jgi:hypothetical protein
MGAMEFSELGKLSVRSSRSKAFLVHVCYCSKSFSHPHEE